MLNFIGVLIDGVSYGALLFLLSVGLSITLGMMGFVNLAHTALAMVGGYFVVSFTQSLHWPFLVSVLVAVLLATVVGIVFERALFRLVYKRSPLAQVLLTIGVMMVIGASVSYIWGPTLQLVQVPEWLAGRVQLGGVSFSRYRMLLLVVSLVLLLALNFGLERTRFGSMVRASVDNQRVAAARPAGFVLLLDEAQDLVVELVEIDLAGPPRAGRAAGKPGNNGAAADSAAVDGNSSRCDGVS